MIDKNNDVDNDDMTLSVLDTELESAVRLIEQDPVVNRLQYQYIVNNEQLCTSDSVHGPLVPGLLCGQYHNVNVNVNRKMFNVAKIA